MDERVIISIRKAKLASSKCIAVTLANRYSIVGSCRRIIKLKGIFVGFNRISLNRASVAFQLPIATSTC